MLIVVVSHVINTCMCDLVKESSQEFGYTCAGSGCMCSFCYGEVFMVKLMFVVNVMNTKFVDNLYTFVVLKL
jgi:hypothetical protein